MSKKPKDYSAFPTMPVRTPDGRLDPDCYSGLTIRQWYAGMALQGMLTSGLEGAIESLVVLGGGSPARGAALAAFGFADAMIAHEKAETETGEA